MGSFSTTPKTKQLLGWPRLVGWPWLVGHLSAAKTKLQKQLNRVEDILTAQWEMRRSITDLEEVLQEQPDKPSLKGKRSSLLSEGTN